MLYRGADYIHKDDKKEARWVCECQCKNRTIKSYRAYALRNGYAKSCGCESKKNQFKKQCNKYDLTKEYGIGWTNNGNEFYFDLDDYNKIKDYCWNISRDGYVLCNSNSKNGRTYFLLHRFITNCDENHDVDHINHNKLDNRKVNLRIVTTEENCMNQKISKANTTGCVGVTRYNNKWVAQITCRKQKIILGTFVNYQDAVNARKEAEEKYFGKFSYENSMKKMEEYKI